MDSSRTSKFDPEQFKSAMLSACDALWTTSKAEMKRWKVFRSFFKRGKGTSVAQTVVEPVMKVENGSHMVSEHDRSTKLEDLKFRREKLLARALAQMQSINAEVQAHLRNVDINVSNDVKSEPLTPPTKDMGVDPISLDTTTMGIADTLPEYHAGDNGLRERNLYSSDTKNERISLDTTTMGIADTLPEYHAGDNGLRERNLYSSDTKNERISISSSISLSQDSLSNTHFPGTKSLISTTKLLPNLRKDSFEPHSAKRGLQDFIQVDPPVFINWLPGSSAKTRPTGLRRGRPPRTDFEHSWQNVLLSLYDGRRRGRPPRRVLPWSHRLKGHRRGRPPNNYSSLETDPVSTVFFIGFPDASCLLHVLLLLDGDVYSVQTTLHFFSKGEEVSSTLNLSCCFFMSGVQFCPFLTILM